MSMKRNVTVPDGSGLLMRTDDKNGLSAVLFEELQDPVPGIGGLAGEALLLPIEEGMRGVGVHDHFVLYVGMVHRLTELVHDLPGDAWIVPRHKGQDRAGEPVDELDRPGRGSARVPVEADRTGQAVTRGSLVPGVGTTEAEAEGEDRA
jgi:hypothetical protein